MRKTPALAALAFACSTLVTPPHASAHAEHGAFVQWRAPEEGQRVSGEAAHIRARVAFGDDGVKSWAVEVVAPPGADYPGFGKICEETVGGTPSFVDIDCAWDTVAYPDDGRLSENHQYLVRITAENARRSVFSPPSEWHGAERRVAVVNGVSAPRDVRLSFSEAGKQATVRWERNPEPDILRYVIQERFGSDPWRTVGEAGGTVNSFTRRLSAPGTYRYQVAALRSAGSDTETLQSAFSGPAAEPREIVVPEPKRPAPTTTSTTSPPPADQGRPPQDEPGPGPRAPGGAGTPDVPQPIEAGGAVNGPPAPGPEPGSPGAAPGGAPGPSGLVTRIEPGAPGTVGSREVSGGNLVAKGAPPQPGRTPPPEPDGPYSETLPYPQQEAPPAAPDEEDEGIAKVLVGLPEVIASDDRREEIVPLAAGLLIFVFAMQGFYLSRRTGDGPLETES